MVDVPAAEEPYQSLYRRYRPQRFGEVRGQEHVTRALRNAVRDGKVAHAYLFSGPRGTGKTSTARILAMALNCAHPDDGEPDGTCDSCVAIRRGSSLDVQELDAASNRGIDEMRDLLSRVALGIPGRWKVYIVDEVHQLTPVAASALLKTLEEPPPHVVFVLATTDPQKVLQTIRSRTQHFELRLLGSETLAGLVREVNEAAGLGVAPEAIDLVVRRGHGSARDALSALDQVAALGEVGDDAGPVSEIVDALAERDPVRVLAAVAEAVGSGRDPRQLLSDLLEQLRNGFLAEQAPTLVMLSDDAASEAARQARSLGRAGVVRALEVLGRAGVDLRDAIDPRVTLEVALVRLAAPEADAAPEGLARRVEHLEAQLARLVATGFPAPAPGVPVAPATVPPAQSRPASPPEMDPPATTAPATDPQGGGLPGPRPATGGAPSGPRPAVGPSRQPLDEPPPLPGRRAEAGRSTLGGLRRGRGAASPPPAGADGQASPPAPGPTTRPASSTSPAPGPEPGPGPRPTPVPALGDAGSPGTGGPATTTAATTTTTAAINATAATAVSAEIAAPSADGAEVPPGGVSVPTRDELTKLWADSVLPGLPGRVKAYLSAGRFVDAGEGVATFALPDPGLLARALSLRAEVEAAIGAAAGVAVRLRLVSEADLAPGGATGASPGAVGAAGEDPEVYDLDELEDAGTAVMSPEQRLLEAFPGAQEVSG